MITASSCPCTASRKLEKAPHDAAYNEVQSSYSCELQVTFYDGALERNGRNQIQWTMGDERKRSGCKLGGRGSVEEEERREGTNTADSPNFGPCTFALVFPFPNFFLVVPSYPSGRPHPSSVIKPLSRPCVHLGFLRSQRMAGAIHNCYRSLQVRLHLSMFRFHAPVKYP